MALYDLYTSPNIIQMIKSRMRWAGKWHVLGTGEVRTGLRWGVLMEENHLEDLDVYRKIILKWVFKKWDGEAGIGLLRLKIGTVGRHL
jgi:hypothetical protein